MNMNMNMITKKTTFKVEIPTYELKEFGDPAITVPEIEHEVFFRVRVFPEEQGWIILRTKCGVIRINLTQIGEPLPNTSADIFGIAIFTDSIILGSCLGGRNITDPIEIEAEEITSQMLRAGFFYDEHFIIDKSVVETISFDYIEEEEDEWI